MLSSRRHTILLAPKLMFITRSSTAEQQKEELHDAVRRHDSLVADNLKRRNGSAHATYDEEVAVHFPAFQLAILPPTNGVHREGLRGSLATHVTEEFRRLLVQPWTSAAKRHVLIVGCRSVGYLQRQLAMDKAHSVFVVDHALSALLDAATALVPRYGPRVHFVRSDAPFLLQRLMPPTTADVCVVPMPVPFWSESGSYRRLVTREFLCLVHRVLRVREGPADPRGIVTFTDTAPLAEFMMEQLEESRLIVPWTRKDPAESYGRWLPIQSPPDREFQQQRLGDVVAWAASKSGPTSTQAEEAVQSFDYKRRYYRALSRQEA
ncbi:hypothetical protein TCDM_07274 [Trypanosoma cruzi Dm28c]|uniref:Uncharacterized protein n=2 Tax=Trypanosoma cruzi TaxID=5693 RepID=V5AUY0_TRYCR|nr:hypothetical protein TCDM_07274 [Trypanosoma cruzi Dm28c]KAF8277297.1 hypothetical protein TcBrA4_0112490 [Trypanosoma cruzi]PBJ72410.1 hypothetical protein BCY84_15606 [Trypanosoma cruzi cruzi]PWU86247.1 hypothetical protein C4B63_128g55 [Trypanosoma cruzi]